MRNQTACLRCELLPQPYREKIQSKIQYKYLHGAAQAGGNAQCRTPVENTQSEIACSAKS